MLNRLLQFSETIGAVALFATMAVIFASVIARYFFQFIIPDAFDFSRMLLGIVIFWGIAAAVAHRSLITADFVYQAVGRTGRRVLDTIGSLVALAVIALLTWRVTLAVQDAFRNGIRTQDIGVPLWGFYGLMALAMLAALVFIGRWVWLSLSGVLPEPAADDTGEAG